MALLQHAAFAVMLMQTVLVGGLIFGWIALSRILRDEGAYSETCSAGSSTCDESNFRISVIFQIGAVGAQCAGMFLGIVLDYFGPKFTNVVGSLLAILGCIGFAFSDTKSVDLFAVSLFALGFGGGGIYMSTFHFANLYPGNIGFATVSGCYDLSAIVFVGYYYLYSAGFLTRREIFICQAIVTGVFLILAFAIQPIDSYHRGEPFKMSLRQFLSLIRPRQKNAAVCDMRVVPGAPTLQSDDDLVKHEIPETQECTEESIGAMLISGLKTTRYVAIVLFLCFTFLRLQFIMSTAFEQLTQMTSDADKVNQLLDALQFLVPLGCISNPLVGYIMDRFGFPFAGFYATILSLIVAILIMIPIADLQFLTFVVWTLCRSAVFSTFFAYISSRFPFVVYGNLTGIGTLLMAIIGLSSLGWYALVLGPLGGKFLIVNIIFLVMVIPQFVVPVVLRKFEISRISSIMSVSQISLVSASTGSLAEQNSSFAANDNLEVTPL